MPDPRAQVRWVPAEDIAAGGLSPLVARLTTIANLRSQIEQGRNGGLWNGDGITSSTLAPGFSLALVDNADLHLPQFRGQFLNDGSLIVVQAHLGDANLDDKVNAFDLNILASHWQQPEGAFWSAGDFDHDGKVNAFDLNLLAAYWQYGAPVGLIPADPAIVAVPEPTSLATALPLLALLLRRRLPLTSKQSSH